MPKKSSAKSPPDSGAAGEVQKLRREINVLRNRCENLKLLDEINRLLINELDYSSLLNQILDKTMEILRAERGFIVTGSPEEFEVKVARNIRGEDLPTVQNTVSSTVVNQVLGTSSPAFIKNAQEESLYQDSQSIVDLGLRSILCVPLIIGEKPYGAIYVENRSVAACFMEEDLELMGELTERAASGIRNALEFLGLRRGSTKVGESLRQAYDFSMIIGKSKKMIEVMEMAARVASTDATVLITGDSGTGKELIARAIFLNSKRKNQPFLTINCGALPTGILESELFGHVKGSFTGAIANKVGRFEAADGGTILMDEVADMPPELQVKLLRVLQFGEFEKVGSYKLQRVDVRIIAATNKDLRVMVERGTFRDDLYYRLKIIEIHFPPLRQRPDDIPLLVEHFVEKHSRVQNKPVHEVDPQFIRMLEKYPFPGNIRELEGIVQRAVILSTDNLITTSDLPPEVLHSGAVSIYPGSEEQKPIPVPRNNAELKKAREAAANRAIDEIERAFLKETLEQAQGIISEAAKLTGMNRSLYQRLAKKHQSKVNKSKYKSD